MADNSRVSVLCGSLLLREALSFGMEIFSIKYLG